MTRCRRGGGSFLTGLAVLVLSAGCVRGLAAAPPATPTPRAPSGTAARVHLTPAPGVSGNPETGRTLFTTRGCGGCHTIPGTPGAAGVAGPNLTNVVLRPTLAGDTLPMSPEMLQRWLLDPPSLKPGTPMPNVGLTPAEAQDLTAFLYSQPSNPRP